MSANGTDTPEGPLVPPKRNIVVRTIRRIAHVNWTQIIAGVVVILPLVGVFYVIKMVLDLGIWISQTVGFADEDYGWGTQLLFAVISLALVVTAVWFVGGLVKNRIGKSLHSLTSNLIQRVPILGQVHSTIQSVLEAIFGTGGKKRFEGVCFVEYPLQGVWVPAFITSRVADKLILYIATSPNPTSGYVVLVNSSRVVETQDLSISQVMDYIVGCGLVVQEDVEAALEKLPTTLIQDNNTQIIAQMQSKIEKLEETVARLASRYLDSGDENA